MNRKELERIRLLPVLGFVLAIFLAFSISVFATEDGTGDIPAEGEVIEAEIEVEEPAVTPDNLSESEELLDGYFEVRTRAYAKTHDAVSYEAKGGIVEGKRRGSNLKGAEKKAYDLLREEVEKVAAGESSDTQFTFTLAQIFPEDLLATRYTADELDVVNLTYEEYNEEEGENYTYPTDEAIEAVVGKCTLDLPSVVNALVYDCPYCLYWFDKTAGANCTEYGVASPEYDDASEVWSVYCVGDESTITFNFAVSLDYAPNTYKVAYIDEKPIPIETDLTKIKSIGDAIENAGSVVAFASENKNSDYEKIDYYRKWICDNVSYNDVAMEDEDTPYGNPWQLIYVFDNDEQTEVVCEGYAKAFKYLCDLTGDFDDTNLDCRLVSGNMDGGQGAGPHMWNIVEIDKKNYLVDITNCDSGTIGAPNLLFMRGNAETISTEVEVRDENNHLVRTYSSKKYIFSDLSEMSFVYDEDTMKIFDSSELILDENDYVENSSGQGSDPTANLITTVDMRNVWVSLDPINDVPFTAEIHDEDDEDGLNFNEKMEIAEEKWVNINDANDVVSRSQPGKLKAGETYGYYVTIKAKDGWKFNSSDISNLTFILGGSEIDLSELYDSVSDTELVIAPLENNYIVPHIDISYAGVSGITNRTYNGNAQTQNPVLEVIVNGTEYTLKKDTDYTLSYKNNTNAGTATVTITGKGIFKGSTYEKFTINRLAINKASVAGLANKTYTGKALGQSLTLKYGGKTLRNGTDYKLSYKNNLKVGRATVTITGYGNFNGSVSKTFNINPKGASLKKLTGAKKGMTVYWNKQTAKMSTARITGYQVQIATDANFKKNVKTYNVKGYKSASRKITGLKAKTRYYVRVRTYQTLKVSGKNTNFYSGWSGKKSVVTKK